MAHQPPIGVTEACGAAFQHDACAPACTGAISIMAMGTPRVPPRGSDSRPPPAVVPRSAPGRPGMWWVSRPVRCVWCAWSRERRDMLE